MNHSAEDARVGLAQNRTGMAKFRTQLALDRTTLAWIRTTLTMATFGFGKLPSSEFRSERQLGLAGIPWVMLFAAGARILQKRVRAEHQ